MNLSLAERVDYLEQIVVNNCPISKLALSKRWNVEKIDLIYDIFDKYSEMYNKKCCDFTYATIERDFNEIGIGRQDLKSIILIFGETGRYENVIKHYLETNYQTFENISSEFIGLWRKYFQ
ncbi:hypothetical protein Q8V47_001517 [Campylobacter jejuni]|uniref:hypothetical protein n=1 Tax=Campylobacter jejuni TaxID=197 RepID=UPI0004589B38|nr:hypothetical protein [Campylobacter jejuni]EAK8713993.1 hypothetical protein [Campylobacter jejuni]EBH4164217.1 hypothetical protein [Campylobacter jejuni]ECP7438477.1 hypothetical protein [Campylobacter jejuni]EDO8426929.1 hypothetical protein [Campylobacter jejuni]EDP2387848.1 hypothetical protein [Campylobacter jejuni]